jgi:alanine racemase
MGVTLLKDIHLAIEQEITLTAHDESWIEELIGLHLAKELLVHLKIDTGMRTIGLNDPVVVARCFHLLKKHPMIKVEGIYTHMSTADEDLDYLNGQVKKFQSQFDQLDLTDIAYIHLANSATLFQFHHSFTQAVRLGIGMYGVNPGGGFISLDFQLKPTLALYSKLSQCKKINKGDKIGYGASYEAEVDEWIGTVPIGYADGWIRRNQGRHVMVIGDKCEIIGRVCMDQLMIRLPKEMSRGTKVTLIGDGMPVEEVAKELRTIEYEIFCLLSDRVPRFYKQNKEIVSVCKMRFERR